MSLAENCSQEASDLHEPGRHPSALPIDDFRMLELAMTRDNSLESAHVKTVNDMMLDMKKRIASACPGVLFRLSTLSFGDGDGAMVASVQGEYVDMVREAVPGLIVYAFTDEGYRAATKQWGQVARQAAERASSQNRFAVADGTYVSPEWIPAEAV